MKHKLISLLSVILVLCIAVSAVGAFSAAVGTAEPTVARETRVKNNINGNSYNRYNSVVRSYLRPVDNGFMRVYGSDDGTLLAEYYNRNYGFVSNRIVPCGLPLFGGFYEYNGYYYVLTGDANTDELDDKEVFRITRFDQSWQVCGRDSIYGGNTSTPFTAGRVSFAAYGDLLIIRTAHRIFFTQGANHQTNMTMVVDTKTGRFKDYFCDISTTANAGFLSHSFNQFVDVDTDGTVVCLDHGDGHPRDATLGRYTTKADNLVLLKANAYDYTAVFSYYGEPGDNITAAMVGGLACSSDAYLTVGTIAGQDENYRTNRAFNAYISATDKTAAKLSSAETKITFLSNFSEEDKRYASNPQLVRISDDQFLVMWNEFPVNTSSAYGYVVDVQVEYDESYLMKYVFVNGKGELTSPIRTAEAGKGIFVSECEPITVGDRVLWFVSDGDEMNAILEMDLQGNITVHGNVFHGSVTIYPIDLSRATVALRSFDPIPADTVINEENFGDYVVVCYKGRMLECGKEYVLAKNSPVTVTASDEEITKITLKLATVDNYSYFPLSYTYNWGVTGGNLYLNGAVHEQDGVHLTVIARRGIGYHVYRKEIGSGADYELIGTVKERITGTFVDTSARLSRAYTYIIREFTYDKDGAEVLSPPSIARSVSAIADEDPTEPPTDPPTQAPTDPPTEAPTDPPTEPPTEPQPIPSVLGDADLSGKVTILDATAIQRHLAAIDILGDDAILCGKVTGGAKLTILDATMIQRHLAGLFTGYSIGEVINPLPAGYDYPATHG